MLNDIETAYISMITEHDLYDGPDRTGGILFFSVAACSVLAPARVLAPRTGPFALLSRRRF